MVRRALVHFLVLFLAGRGFRNVLEGLFNVGGVFCAHFEELDVPVRLAPLLRLGLLDLALAGLVELVAENDEGKMFWIFGLALHEEFVAPRVERVEGFRIGDVVDENAAICSSVEGAAQGLKALLACGVPNLRRHRGEGVPGE